MRMSTAPECTRCQTAVTVHLSARQCPAAKTTLEWLRDKSLTLLQWPSQSQDLNPLEHLCSVLKTALHMRFPSNLTELERICQEELDKLPKSRCAKLGETNLQSLMLPNGLLQSTELRV